jgi:PAS domain S-box-containing protein
MKSVPLIINEKIRLEVLRLYNQIDESCISSLQAITEIAKELFNTPIAAIGFMEEKRISFKASVGLNVKEIPREGSICECSILEDEPTIIRDARLDSRFSESVLVTNSPGVRFYAGVPLIDPLGIRLGTLCVIDTMPRAIDPNKILLLKYLAQSAISHLQIKTTQSSANKYLEKHEEQYKLIFEHAAIGIAKVSLNGHFLEFNDALVDFLGYSRDELQRLRYQDITYPEDANVGAKSVESLILNKIQKVTFEKRYLRKDGVIVWSNVSVSIHRSQQNIPLFFISVIKDITERKKQENAILSAKASLENAIKRAHMAERTIIKVSEDVSKKIGMELHDDLGQHLTGISFAIETLFRNIESDGYQLPSLANKISLMFDDAISKTRHLAHNLYPVDVEELNLEELLTDLTNQVNLTHKITCKCEISENNINDSFVVLNIYRIVQEAINNAIKHSKATTALISLTSNKQFWILSVSDNGIGLKKHASKKKNPIRGLGLVSMDYRSNLIGANIDVIQNENLGTTVQLTLKKK